MGAPTRRFGRCRTGKPTRSWRRRTSSSSAPAREPTRPTPRSRAARRRLAADADRELEQRTRNPLRGFLDVVDDLDRAIEATRKLQHDPEALAGVELVRRERLVHLGQLGVTDAAQVGRVVAVLREGYSVADDILRPAGVAVGERS
jgi:molecular chaperone GrpE (heat shock protein)